VRGRPKNLWWGAAIEAPDPVALAGFYSTLLDWPVVNEEAGAVVVKPPQESVFLVFQPAEDYLPPAWPPAPGEQRAMMHLDIQVEDLDAAVGEALALGARLAEFQPRDNVRVLLDPAGHPFCLCLDEDD
jgi:catechol 2,3-dioxygenase-like lactoylglutathione lyase family enzyme